MKSLIGVHPTGAIMYVSNLYTGRISDKQLVQRSGILKLMEEKIESGELNRGDAIMADKGFDIADDLEKIGIKLNIPPFKRGQVQFSIPDVVRTRTVAAHRIHVERAIRKVKVFKIFDGRFPISLLSIANQLWTVCCILTNFMPPIVVEDKDAGNPNVAVDVGEDDETAEGPNTIGVDDNIAMFVEENAFADEMDDGHTLTAEHGAADDCEPRGGYEHLENQDLTSVYVENFNYIRDLSSADSEHDVYDFTSD